jgi:hypothetical protein
MVANPFLDTLEAIDKEIQIRQARTSYLEYVKYTNQGYKESKFHNYLCNNIQKFMEKNTSSAFDILLLSVP